MTTYFMFGQYSADAIKKISAKRTEDALAMIAELGGEYKDGYALLGKYDLILIADFPGTEQAMNASVTLTKKLGISFTTLPAVSVAEFDKLIG
ncbi:MAG: GYD domain-containing protein [Anaerolineaceae bacterium]|jgi:uncharacterized protein with GYD domain|nr:GYD domain-containing protein [Anaerolineaceae bacterium]